MQGYPSPPQAAPEHAPPPPVAQGYAPPSPVGQEYAPPPQAAQGYAPPPQHEQGYASPPPAQGYAPPPPAAQGYAPTPPAPSGESGGSKSKKTVIIAISSIVAVLAIVFAALWFFTDILPFGSGGGYSGGSSSSSRDRDRDDDRDRDGDNGNGDNGDNGDNGSGDTGSGSAGSGSAGGGSQTTQPDAQSVVGSWILVDGGYTTELELRSDGRYFMIMFQAGGLDSVYVGEGRYTVSGSSIQSTEEYAALYNHNTNEILGLLDINAPVTYEFSFNGNNFVLIEPDSGESISYSPSPSSAIWSFNHRANATIATTPPADGGPSPASENYLRVLNNGEFFLGFFAGDNEFEFYAFDGMMALFMQDPGYGVVNTMFHDGGVVMIYYDLETYIEMDYDTAYSVLGDDGLSSILSMYEELVIKMDGMAFTQSGSTSFQGRTLPYDEYTNRNRDVIRFIYDRDTVVGLTTFIDGYAEDVPIVGYSTLNADNASRIFYIPDGFERISF